MNELITVLEIVFGLMLGRFLFGFWQKYREMQIENFNAVRRHLDEIVHRVEEVQEGDVTYWYDLDDGEFLAQGYSFDEIVDTLKSRFPRHIFCLHTEQYIAAPQWVPRNYPIEIAE